MPASGRHRRAFHSCAPIPKRIIKAQSPPPKTRIIRLSLDIGVLRSSPLRTIENNDTKSSVINRQYQTLGLDQHQCAQTIPLSPP